jgi:replicative DNA helicase
MVHGPDGCGKTTLVQQLMLRRIGVLKASLLGGHVEIDETPALYIAADRPKQARRSLSRMISGDRQLETLESRLLVWEGPLPFSLHDDPRKLLEFIGRLGCRSVYVDGLKDIALDLVKDEVGARVSQAFQYLMAAGIEACVLHHPRKDPAGSPQRPKSLEDVYGSRWIVAGMGSVVALWGNPGDLVVQLTHLKQPTEEFGPMRVFHDHERGVTTPHEQHTLEEIMERTTEGLAVAEAARQLFGCDSPSRNEIEKARRKLDSLVKAGSAESQRDVNGASRYFSVRGGA